MFTVGLILIVRLCCANTGKSFWRARAELKQEVESAVRRKKHVFLLLHGTRGVLPLLLLSSFVCKSTVIVTDCVFCRLYLGWLHLTGLELLRKSGLKHSCEASFGSCQMFFLFFVLFSPMPAFDAGEGAQSTDLPALAQVRLSEKTYIPFWFSCKSLLGAS